MEEISEAERGLASSECNSRDCEHRAHVSYLFHEHLNTGRTSIQIVVSIKPISEHFGLLTVCFGFPEDFALG